MNHRYPYIFPRTEVDSVPRQFDVKHLMPYLLNNGGRTFVVQMATFQLYEFEEMVEELLRAIDVSS